MKSIYLFILVSFAIMYAHPLKKSEQNNGKEIPQSFILNDGIVGVYEPTTRKCPKLNNGYNRYCEEDISQFEIIKGGAYASYDNNKLSFLVWVPKFLKSHKHVNKLNLTTNGEYIFSLLNKVKLKQDIILEESKKENFVVKIKFLDQDNGIYTFGYNDNLLIMHFKRISKSNDKYNRFYRK